jgi:intracellular sulfur oxidation DsrE/DsrF family protein
LIAEVELDANCMFLKGGVGMKSVKSFKSLLVLVCLLFISAMPALGEGYAALTKVKAAKAVFDVRMSNPKSAALILDLIHKTYKDENIVGLKKDPKFVVVFSGPAVKLISTDKSSFTPEEQMAIDKIAETIKGMSADGITLEICVFATTVFNVDPATVLPEIVQVPNGFISLIGYQAKGYSLVPAY